MGKTKKKQSGGKAKLFKTITLVATVILAGSYIYAGFHGEKPKEKVKTYTVKKADPYVFEGSVEAKRVSKISIDPSKGRLRRVHVSNGQLVRKHQVLLSYKNTSVRSQIKDQKKTVYRSRRTYVDAYDDYIALVRSNQKALKKSKKKKLTAEQTSAQKTLRETMQTTRDAYNDAKEVLRTLESKRTTYVKAKIAGYVAIDAKGKDDYNTPYLTITSDKVDIVGSVSEYDFEKIKAGQDVDITVVSSEKKIHGKINRVNQVPTTDSSASLTGSDSSESSQYQFYVTPDEEIQYGFSVDIVIPVNEIQVPSKYIHNGKDGYYAYVYKSGQAVKTDVNVTQKEGYYVINSGLNVKDKLVDNHD